MLMRDRGRWNHQVIFAWAPSRWCYFQRAQRDGDASREGRVAYRNVGGGVTLGCGAAAGHGLFDHRNDGHQQTTTDGRCARVADQRSGVVGTQNGF